MTSTTSLAGGLGETAMAPGADDAQPTVAYPTATALAMLAAPSLLFVAELISPIDDATDTSAERVADILDHSERYTVAVVCLLGAMLLLVPAVLGLRRFVVTLSETRGARAGTTLAAAGFMLFAVASGALGVGPTAWASVEMADRATLVGAFDAMDGGKGAMPIVQFGPMVALIGLVVVTVALWRHTSYPRWASVALSLGWATFLFAPVHAARAAGALVLLAGFAPVIALRAQAARVNLRRTP
jgi:hypothetical protein